MERLPCSRMAEQSASVDDSPRWLRCGRIRGSPRGGSSAGRASRSQCEGREFDPPPLHQNMALIRGLLYGVLLAASSAWGQGFPSKPVTLIVPFPPGGSTDTAARIIGERMRLPLGQSVI